MEQLIPRSNGAVGTTAEPIRSDALACRACGPADAVSAVRGDGGDVEPVCGTLSDGGASPDGGLERVME